MKESLRWRRDPPLISFPQKQWWWERGESKGNSGSSQIRHVTRSPFQVNQKSASQNTIFHHYSKQPNHIISKHSCISHNGQHLWGFSSLMKSSSSSWNAELSLSYVSSYIILFLYLIMFDSWSTIKRHWNQVKLPCPRWTQKEQVIWWSIRRYPVN